MKLMKLLPLSDHEKEDRSRPPKRLADVSGCNLSCVDLISQMGSLHIGKAQHSQTYIACMVEW